MTKEEGKLLWKMEKMTIKEHEASLSPAMKELYDTVDELIEADLLTYKEFSDDMLDAMTTNIVKNGKSGKEPNRKEQVAEICENLLEKYNKLKPNNND